jgi:hypothetical protein
MTHSKYKLSLLAIVMLLACLIINFAAYRMAIAFQVSFASTESEITNARAIAFALTTFGLIFSSVTVHFWHEKAFIVSILCGCLTALVFVYETHGAWGHMRQLNE